MYEHQYSLVDRLMHRLAFSTWPIQAALADMEQMVFKTRLAGIGIDRPVFVAGLPRAGTTLALQLIENTGEFASYQYQDMPFLLCPLMWRQFSRSAERSVEVRERAHGDGVAIGIESPEAFEEVVWRTFWPKRYEASRIKPWPKRSDPEFEAFFRLQMRKIVAIRTEGRPTARRYLSKCNGNIARLDMIARMFPGAALVVPYRDPLQQAQSLLRQHLNFLEMHRTDPFTRDYMAGIGHYDFGQNLKPIDFGGWLDGRSRDFTTLNAWLEYWCAAYGALADTEEAPLFFLSYDRLRRAPQRELARLEDLLGLRVDGALTRQAADIRSEERSVRLEGPLDPGLLADAERIVARLEARQAQGRPPTAQGPAADVLAGGPQGA